METRAAGDLATWFRSTLRVLDDAAEADVACAGCTACCRSSQFVHVGPDEHDALAHIPAELLFDAPGAPPGFKLMGYDDQGRCPMLSDEGCTIYAHRPQTCRAFDCRVFTATGFEPDADKPAIAEAAARWRFDLSSSESKAVADRLRKAGDAVRGRDEPEFADRNLTGLGAALAVVTRVGSVPGTEPTQVR